MSRNSAAPRRDPSSFRDDRGFIFWQDGELYRQINDGGRESYDALMSSGLYEQLVNEGLLVAHTEVEGDLPSGAYKVIRPERVPVISYPYEWAFSQLQDAALATLRIQRLALEQGLILRDASAYNIQLVRGRPQLIDTLSFEPYRDGQPWVAYRQFCQHFVAPLALMARVDVQLQQLLRVYLDGIPLALAARLLPARARLNLGLATHIHLHAKFQRQHQGTAQRVEARVSTASLKGVVANLEATVRGLKLPHVQTEWGDYYQHTNYSDTARTEKAAVVSEFVAAAKPGRVLDLGANDGPFSRLAAEAGALVLSADVDPVAVETNYRRMRAHGETRLWPLLIDLTNPSPALGWAHEERMSFSQRAQADLVMALALIHHLAIGNNLPLELVAQYFARLGQQLVIEFVPKQDSQVQRLLATREDIFPDYTLKGFETAFGKQFEVVHKRQLRDASRVMYLMRRKAGV